MKKEQERRKHKRIKKPFMATFQIRAHTEGKKNTVSWDRIAVLDLGAGGMLFYYNKNIETGSLLDLKVDFSPETALIQCVGKVVRVEEIGHAFMFFVAVVFTEMGKKEKELLNKAAEALHSQKS